MLIKPYKNFEDYSVKNFECSEINANGLSPKRWTTLHSKFYAEDKYSDHTQKIFISFQHTISSARSQFTLLN